MLEISKFWKRVKDYFNLQSEVPTKTLTIKMVDSKLQFEFTPDITPEDVAIVIVRMATTTDSDAIIEALKKHGYNDIVYRIRKASNDNIEEVLEEIYTRPDSNVKVTVEDAEPKKENKPEKDDDDRPLLEALIPN
jgi:hypothetical protein